MKIVAYSKYSGRFIGNYESIKEASSTLKLHKSNIYRCLNGELNSVGNYYFKKVV